MNIFLKITAFIAATLTLSCGGGGAGGTTSASTQITAAAVYLAAKYEGFYLGKCELIPNAINLETNAVLYGRLYQTIGKSDTASAALEWRLDIYDTPTCTGSAVGYVENKNAANKVTVVGQSTSMGSSVDKVIVSFGGVDLTKAISVSSSTVVIGNAIRLSLPAEIFSSFEYADIWSVLGGKLYEGGTTVDMDGFPITLDYVSPSEQLITPLPLPPAACAAKAVSWTNFGIPTCEATLVSQTSGTKVELSDAIGPVIGTSGFSCLNGQWSAPMNPVCSQPISNCSPQTVTWNIGGNVCTVFTNTGVQVGATLAVNTTNTTGNVGNATLACTATGQFELDPVFRVNATCAPVPPPKPQSVDLQLATEKNCMVCHSVTVDSIGPSFKRIADYYRGKQLSPLAIEFKIINGSVGTFGQLPMPANSQVSLTDAFFLRSWILSQ